MVSELLEGFDYIDLGPDGGVYEVDDPWKIELHMTQGDSIEGAEGAFAPYPSHLGCEYEGKKRHQYVPLTRSSYSNLGGHNDRSHTIQVEIVGRSENAPDFWPEELDWIGTDVLAPLKRAGIDFEMTMAPQGFHGGDEGIKPYLASASSPIRFPTLSEMRAFSGVLGHQHEPPPDDHWDPGRLDIPRILVACAWSLGIDPTIPAPVALAPDAGPPPPPTWYNRVLSNQRPMMSGWDVVKVQSVVIEQGHGYRTTVDGWFGDDTEYSVKSFQRERGLTDDGIVGPATATAMGE